DPAAHHRQQDERDQHGGKAEDEIHDAHDEGVDETADIGGDQPRHAADGGRNGHGGNADDQTAAQPVQNGAQHVAALTVGAQPLHHAIHGFRQRRQPAVEQVQAGEVVRVLGGEEGCAEDQDDQYGQRDHGAPDRGPPSQFPEYGGPPRRFCERLYGAYAGVRIRFGHGVI